MMPAVTLTLVDGVRVVVPNSLNLITPYVLREQEDWFESEIKFLRRLLQPGQKVIDIGANYGTYALSMARAVGSAGRVWAFEPASGTAALLAEGIAANGFAHVTLVRSALSNCSGTAQLSLNPNSELNALVHEIAQADASETVPLMTLDQCLETYGWHDIEFVKIDAEGEEANILKGGERFFSGMSPLILYEVKADRVLHMELVQAFADIGYESYRLVPGLDLLVRFDAGSQPDKYLLNLFCCKPDRATTLASQGFLLEGASGIGGDDGQETAGNLNMDNQGAYDWRSTVSKLPYGVKLANAWERTVAAGRSGGVLAALADYVRSQDPALSAAARFGALESSLNRLKGLCELQPSHTRLATLARVALDYGARHLAGNALSQLKDSIFQTMKLDVGEPFLPPSKRYDSIDPGGALVNWFLSSVLEEVERVLYFSSYYAGPSALHQLEYICDLGFASPEMKRRLELVRQRIILNKPGASGKPLESG